MLKIMLKENFKVFEDGKVKNNKYIIYWMQSAQRVKENPALDYAANKANDLEVPLIVFFNLSDQFPEANYRHYYFMLEGLKDVKSELEERGIGLIIKKGQPAKNLQSLSKKAIMVISERGYLRTERLWRKQVAQSIDCRFVVVNTNTIVPVDIVTDKEEYGAYTIRKKIQNKIERFVDISQLKKLKIKSLRNEFKSINLDDIEQLLSKLNIDRSVTRSSIFKGGSKRAVCMLNNFLENKLRLYENYGSSPDHDLTSKLSPYLHFGQISPSYIYKKIKEKDIEAEDYLEQLIVRRELSFNFIYFNKEYDTKLSKILPNWAIETLQQHSNDQREYIYSLKELENYDTHDNYWNAAQKEMVLSGYMNGYMRMYWGKKILEWTPSPQKAYEFALFLNNKYFLDGRDPNSYAGVAWIFGKHDRAWKERNIYGKVRYMNKTGLDRKFNMEKYLKKVDKLS
ncbi:MAG: deoxyribodipyrimidine photo-lyase [Halanaerobiales bacterium]